MELDKAIELLKKTVKNNGTNDTKHIDLGLFSTEDRPQYEKALMVVKKAMMDGKLNQEDFAARVHLT